MDSLAKEVSQAATSPYEKEEVESLKQGLEQMRAAIGLLEGKSVRP